MSAFQNPAELLHTEAEYQAVLVDYHRDLVRDAMLGRIVMFGCDPTFQRITEALAAHLRCDPVEAAELLCPTAKAIYRAAAQAHG